MGMNDLPDPDPRDMTDRALRCARDACIDSEWPSDRQFSVACAAELDRRLHTGRGPNHPTREQG